MRDLWKSQKEQMELIISSMAVKPTSPTPSECKTHKFSYFDQWAPRNYISLIFFYQNNNSKHHADVSTTLTQSLSQVLSIFYPLAGEIKDNSSVDCNDRGAEFVEARVRAPLHHFTHNPKMHQLRQLLSRDVNSHRNDTILSVKISFFNCGGVALGVCLSHKVADAASLAAFLKAWAASCRGEDSSIIHPCFDLALHFPPGNVKELELEDGKGENIVMNRLVLEREKVEEVKKLWSKEVEDASSVEAVSAFIWKSFIDANSGEHPSSSLKATHAVNLRPRTEPPMAAAFGNCAVPTLAVVSGDEGDVHVSKLRDAIRAVDANNGVKALSPFSSGEICAETCCAFTSWRRFGFYDVDFGWGKPIWVATAPPPSSITTVVVLMDTHPSIDGVEVWVVTPHHLQPLFLEGQQLVP